MSALPFEKNASPPCRVERPCTSALRVSTRAAELTDAFIISVDKAYTHLNVGTMHIIRRSKKEVERAAELVVRGGVGARRRIFKITRPDRGIPRRHGGN